MSRKILAIDIRKTTVSAVLLNTGLKNSVVQNSLFVPLSDDGQDGEALTHAIEAVLQQFNCSDAGIVAAIPADLAFYRTLQVPFRDDKKIRQILPFEIESFLPVGVENLVIDFQKGAEGEPTSLLATAIEHSNLQYYLDIFGGLQKQPQMVVPGPLPTLISLLPPQHGEVPSERTVLLDVDNTRATLYAVHNGNIALVRSLSIPPKGDADMESLALQVRQTLMAYADAAASAFEPESVLLCGPAMRDDLKRQALGASLPWPVEPLDLRTLSPKVELNGASETYNPWLMDNALALALIEAEGRNCPSFHRSSSPLRDFWTGYRSLVTGPAILATVVLLIGLLGIVMENRSLQHQVDELDARMRSVVQSVFPNAPTQIGPLDYMKSKLKDIQSNAPTPVQGITQVRSIDIFYEMSRLIPKELDVHFSRINIGSDSVTLSGTTSGYNVVDDIKKRLEQSDLFRQVEMTSANKDKSGETISFKFKIDL